MVPEKRSISYIVIAPNNFKNQFTPSNTQIENYYNNNKNIFLEPERRDFIQFNFKSLESANEFKNNILALNSSEIIEYANKNNILFNEFSKISENEVLESLSNAIFNLEKNQVSKVIETALAKHIVVLNNIYPEKQATLNDSKQCHERGPEKICSSVTPFGQHAAWCKPRNGNSVRAVFDIVHCV